MIFSPVQFTTTATLSFLSLCKATSLRASSRELLGGSEAPTGSSFPSHSMLPTNTPSESISSHPSSIPSKLSSESPSGAPSEAPSESPTVSASPSSLPTLSVRPSGTPSSSPSEAPSSSPSVAPPETCGHNYKWDYANDKANKSSYVPCSSHTDCADYNHRELGGWYPCCLENHCLCGSVQSEFSPGVTHFSRFACSTDEECWPGICDNGTKKCTFNKIEPCCRTNSDCVGDNMFCRSGNCIYRSPFTGMFSVEGARRSCGKQGEETVDDGDELFSNQQEPEEDTKPQDITETGQKEKQEKPEKTKAKKDKKNKRIRS